MKKKKAQISGQVFVYIFAIIVAGAIIVFGYKAINGLVNAQPKLDFTLLKKQLSQDAESAKGYGTVFQDREYAISGFKRICFVDTNPGRRPSPDLITVQGKEYIKSDLESGAEQNTYLLPKNRESFFFIQDLAVKGETANYACFEATNGRVKISMIGCGDKTLITQEVPSDQTSICPQNAP